MKGECDVGRIFFVHVSAKSVRFHPRSDWNVRLVDEIKTTYEGVECFQQFVFVQPRRKGQAMLVLEQLDEQESRTVELQSCGGTQSIPQIEGGLHDTELA